MKALHVFPFYGGDLADGAARYQARLSEELAGLGVEIEVLTTRTRQIEAPSAFGLRWPADWPATSVAGPGPREGLPLSVERFGARWSLPVPAGRFASRQILHRWEREARAAASDPRGGDAGHVVERRFAQALARSRAYDVLSLLGRGPNSPRLLRELIRRSRHADVALVGYAPFALPWWAGLLRPLLGCPLVVLPLFHPNDPYHHFGEIYRTFERADGVLVQTAYTRDLFARHLPRARCFEIGVGVDVELWEDATISGARFRKQHGLGDRRVALFVGRKEEGKRWDLAVEAVERLGRDDTVLVMVGPDTDRQPIRSERVLHVGRLEASELRDAYDACDVLIHPSLHESFGFVLLEAWMRIKPVLGHRDCGPVAAVIGDGRDGYLCRDAHEFAARLGSLLDDRALARRLGEAGRKKAETRYAWPELARRVAAVYGELVAAGRRGGA